MNVFIVRQYNASLTVNVGAFSTLDRALDACEKAIRTLGREPVVQEGGPGHWLVHMGDPLLGYKISVVALDQEF